MQVCARLADLDPHCPVRVFHIHPQVRHAFQHIAAGCGADFGRSKRKAFVCTLGLDLERAYAGHAAGEIFVHTGAQFFHRFAADGGGGYARKAEHLRHAVQHALKVAVLALGLDIDRALHTAYRKVAVSLGPRADPAKQHRLKMRFVCALEHQFSVFAKDNFFHISLVWRRPKIRHISRSSKREGP